MCSLLHVRKRNIPHNFTMWFLKKSNKISNTEKLFHIFVSIVILWIGVQKIRNDLVVISNLLHNNDLWIKIIESFDVMIFILMVIVVNFENLTKEKNPFNNMENFKTFDNEKMYYSIIILKLSLYSCLFFIVISQHLFADSRKEYLPFFLSLCSQYYLLYTELEFVQKIIKIKIHFNSINSLVENLLEGRKSIWWIDKKNRRSEIFHVEECVNVHWLVCKFVQKVNHEYSLRLLFLIICIFYKLMFIPYLSSLHLIKAYSENLMKELLRAGLLLFHFTELTVLACSTDSANDEAEKLKFILCEFIKGQSELKDIDVAEMMLGNLLIHESEFKIYTLFKLNRPFILSIFGSVVTYMVIFIQLQDALNISQLSSLIKKMI